MPDITQFDIAPIEELKSKLELYKYNPSLMQRVILDTLTDVTNGKINIVDPTNPFIFLLESSVVNTSLFIQENYVNLRRQYPVLAQSSEDLYLHMSDKDYIGRFSTPSRGVFTIAIAYNDLLNAPYDASVDGTRLTIPKDTEIFIDNVKFTFSYAIEIIRHSNNIMRVQYTAVPQNPLMPLSKSLINYTARHNTDGSTWIFFDIEVLQLEISSIHFPIEFGVSLNKKIPYSDLYTYCRIYYRNDTTLSKWVELKTTHNQMTYDVSDPTVLLRVHEVDKLLEFTLPSIYTNNELISGDLRVDIYTTKGDLTLDMSTFKVSSFENRLRSLDDENEIDDYTNALSNSSYVIFSDKISSGGSNGIEFTELRKRVINNAAGDRQIPISNVQLNSYVENQGFNIYKNIDLVTNRIFIATKKLPNPNNKKIITPATIGASTLIINPGGLGNGYNTTVNQKSVTIRSESIFKLTNGSLSMLRDSEIADMKALPPNAFISHVNSNSYFYNPFYYVYDQTDTTDYGLRVYHLDQPKINYINFVNQNNTLQLAVNTGDIKVSRVPNGYKLTITTRSGNFYKQLDDSRVALQLSYIPVNDVKLAFINARQVGVDSTGERIYEILLEDNLDIDKDNFLTIISGSVESSITIETPINLTHSFNLVYSTDSLTAQYRVSSIDDKVSNFLLTDDFKGISEELVNITLGYSLDNVWSKTRPIISDMTFKKYSENIPLLYSSDIYETDPITGSIFTVDEHGDVVYNIKHKMHDPVLDAEGNPVYKYRIGDIILDENSQPILESTVVVGSEVSLLLADAKYLLSNTPIYKEYRTNLANTIHTWCSVNLAAVQNLLLEQTKIYYYPATTFSSIKATINKERTLNIDSEVFFTVKMYLRPEIRTKEIFKEDIIQDIITILDTYLDTANIYVDDIIAIIKNKYANIVSSVQINGMNDDKDLYNVEILDQHKRFNLKKKLVLENDGNVYVTEDIVVEFHQ